MSDDYPGYPRVQGYCPRGCGQTLMLGEAGHVTCSSLSCPDPTVVDEVLSESETEHLVVVESGVVHMQHPLRERAKRDLLGCTLYDRIITERDTLAHPGQWRVSYKYPADPKNSPLVWEFRGPQGEGGTHA